MSYGLEILNSSGGVTLSISDRTPRLRTIVTGVTVPTSSTGTTTVTVSGAATTDIALTDAGAPAVVTSANTVTVYGTNDGGTTNLKVLAY